MDEKSEVGCKKWLPHSPSGWIVALLFGAAAFAVHWSGIALPIPGTHATTDLHEIFVVLGAALSGPFGGALVGLLAGLGGFTLHGSLAFLFAHISAGLWIGFAYKSILCRRLSRRGLNGLSLRLLLGWLGLLSAYYTLFLAPVFVLALVDFDSARRQLLFGGQALGPAYLHILRGLFPEFLLTAALTALALVILPRKYRSPLW